MFKTLLLLLCVCCSLAADSRSLFDDLAQVERIDKELADRLPFFYNNSLVGGYFSTPSARMRSSGMAAFGGGSIPPYTIYGLNFQAFDHIELSANYRVFNGIIEKNFGQEGFGDDAERIGNIKIAGLLPEDGYPYLPSVAVGADDFFGTKRFNSQYIVFTKQWLSANLELSLGWAKGRMRNGFGGAAWSPFRSSDFSLLKQLSVVAEYDPTNYKKHPHEHPKGRVVKSRFNGGLIFTGGDVVQVSVGSVRGEELGLFGSFRYPLGTSKGFFPKVDDPVKYTSPVDTEPLGVTRPDEMFVQEIVYAFSDQGLDVYRIYLKENEEGKGKELWIKLVNNRYREESVVRDRVQHVLAALVPSNIALTVVIVEANAIPCQSYRFYTTDLRKYLNGTIGDEEMRVLTPMREAGADKRKDAPLVFHRTKPIWTFTVQPRLLTFFGSTQGKFKYNVGMVASPEGYLFDEVYYKFQLGYSIKSSMMSLSATDRINPSHLFNVRTDTIRYFQSNTVSMEEAYLQKGWNLGNGCYFRLATGYFEPAYGGVATELLYYPINSNWAIGLEEATVMKRRYQGVAFTSKVRKVNQEDEAVYKKFVGQQFFLDLYYLFRPLQLDFKVTVGQFLAKDVGARFEVMRCFASGLKVALWYTVTNGHDKVNGSTYYDKGFAFYLPLDMFLKQSSRNFFGYAMSAWLRDVGASAMTGKPLYQTLYNERYDCN